MRITEAGILIACCVAAACSGADHDALAARDASAGSGGSIIEAGTNEAGEDAHPTTDAPGEDAPPADSSFVPDGPSVFTFVNGMPNARAIRVCFERETTSGFEPMNTPPLPDDPSGLRYGWSFTASSLTGIDLGTTAVRPVVYGDELNLMEGRSCDELDGVAGLGRAELQVISAGTLDRGRSVLMVAAGCFAEPLVSDGTEVCGPGFVSSQPNAALLVASMERAPLGTMGMQVFGGSLATEKLSVDHVTAFPAMTTSLVRDIAPGQMDPRPPTGDLPVGNLGTSADQNTLRVFSANASEPLVVVPLTEALERGGLSLGSLGDDANFTVVVVGPKAGMAMGDWYQEGLITVVPSAP